MKVCFAIIVYLIVVSMETTHASTDNNLTSACMCLSKEVGELYNPVEYVTIKRDNSRLTLVVEQRGVVRAFLEDWQERANVFLDIRDRVTATDAFSEERGLLSLVLHPNYTQTGGDGGRVFAYYITTVSGSDYAVVSEFHAAHDVVDVASERHLIRTLQPSARGNGGQLLFGDDGYLYIFTGDGTGNDDLPGHAQDPQSFLGKALRVDVNRQGFEEDGEGSARSYLYGIPSSNPFLNHSQVWAEVFALGFRNPWRCSQDSVSFGGTGSIFCGDTGTDHFEEINVVTEGRNYGWNLKEGDYCFNRVNCSIIENEGKPIYTYPHTGDMGNAVVGGFVYRGAQFAPLVGHYLYGDVVSGQVYRLQPDDGEGGRWHSRPWPLCRKDHCPCHARDLQEPFLLAFGRDPQGEVMLMMTSEFAVLRPKGRLYRVHSPTRTEGKVVTCGACSLTRTFITLVLTVTACFFIFNI